MMGLLSEISLVSKVVLFVLLGLMGLFSVVLLWAQIRCIRGIPFQNPDGTADDWREQKIFYGIAWADILVACPTSFGALVAVFVAPRLGLILLGMAGILFLWSNVMTTVTSLRFERPKVTPEWIVVFPTGGVVGLAIIVWILTHVGSVLG